MAFVSQITGLDPGEHYYVRAYATNEGGTAYGPEEEFDTLGVATKTLSPEYDVASSLVQKTLSPSYDVKSPTSFVSQLTALQPGEHYYVRAYATTEAGTAYGPEVEFDTGGSGLSTLSPVYEIGGPARSDLAVVYNVGSGFRGLMGLLLLRREYYPLSVVAKTLTDSYAIRAAARSQLSDSYALRTLVRDALAAGYVILGAPLPPQPPPEPGVHYHCPNCGVSHNVTAYQRYCSQGCLEADTTGEAILLRTRSGHYVFTSGGAMTWEVDP